MLNTVSKAGKVLDLYSFEVPEWGVNEVAKVLDMPKSSTSDLMTSLAEQGLLERTSHGKYRLGWRLFELSRTLVETTDFYAEASSIMEELVSRWGETVRLGMLRGSQIICVEQLQTKATVKALLTRMTWPIPLHASSIGKVLLAYRERSEASRLLQAQGLKTYTQSTITDIHRLMVELQQVRRQGFAFDQEEVIVGLCGIAAPIVNNEGQVNAGIAILLPASRFYTQQASFTAIILDAARTISKRLGHSGQL